MKLKDIKPGSNANLQVDEPSSQIFYQIYSRVISPISFQLRYHVRSWEYVQIFKQIWVDGKIGYNQVVDQIQNWEI